PPRRRGRRAAAAGGAQRAPRPRGRGGAGGAPARGAWVPPPPPPMPRMTNTFMLAGQDEPADIIRSVPRGLYAVNFGGGQVDITNGRFVFSASEAYLIEDGQITKPVKGATLIGNGPEALSRGSRVGHALKLEEGVGTCGKDGQSVPVGVGLPTIRIDRMTVGGTQV